MQSNKDKNWENTKFNVAVGLCTALMVGVATIIVDVIKEINKD